MTGPTSDPTTPTNQTTTNTNPNDPTNLQDQILNHISLKALVQLHNESPTGLVRPIRLSFDEEGVTGEKNDEEPEDLRSLTRKFSNLRLADGSSNLREAFVERVALRRKCCKDLTEVSKIVRKANETLPNFKERWTKEMSYILDVPVVMQISSFMSNSKLARRFSDQVPKTVTEMMKRVDDFVKSEEVFKNTEFPRGEHPEKGATTQFRRSRPPHHSYGNGPSRTDAYNRKDHYQSYVPFLLLYRRCDNRRNDYRRQEVNHLRLDSLTKLPSEILATELQLQLPSCPLTLEVALGSGKLNHLIKDVRQRGNNRGRQAGNSNGQGKVINMVQENGNRLKHKASYKQTKEWMNVPITFPPISTDDVSDGPLIVEAEVEGYWVRRIFVDQGVAVQVMFEHCFDNLSPDIKAQLTPTQTELVGFSGEQLIPIEKIKLEVCFGGGGLTRNTMMIFMVVQGSSPYNVILGRTGLQKLRAISFTIHAMMKFPTPKGIATLCARAEPVYECRCEQLIRLLKDNMDVFAWQSSDMAGVPRRLIRHALNVNNSVPPVAQKRRVIGPRKMPFDLKNPRATYQRLVDSAFQAQLGRNLKAYVHDMVIKSKTEQDMIMDIAETFDNLRKINMKLNPMKCLFGVGKGKRSLPFFETLKNITKENKEDYKWTEEAEHAFQELKKLILELPTLTTPEQKEALFVYLAASRKAVSGVLVADRKGKQTSIRLHRYFEAHPIKVIIDQPIKQILNKPEVSGKLAKYAMELGTYNITYIPRTTVKGQVLADFINEIPVGTKQLEICNLVGEGDPKGWTLYMDGASSQKGVGVGLVLIDPSGTEYTYAIRLTFPSTNNEAEYEALLAGIRIAQKMKVQALDMKMDSKLVACQMNGEFVGSSEGMVKYMAKEKEQAASFKKFSIKNIPKNQNQKTDMLSKLASVAFNHLTKEILVEVLNAKSVDA
ncbi:reverse transcriptase domain-containing protein [Tanacetum coccineum]